MEELAGMHLAVNSCFLWGRITGQFQSGVRSTFNLVRSIIL